MGYVQAVLRLGGRWMCWNVEYFFWQAVYFHLQIFATENFGAQSNIGKFITNQKCSCDNKRTIELENMKDSHLWE